MSDSETRAAAADERAREIMSQATKSRDAASSEAVRIVDSAKSEASAIISSLTCFPRGMRRERDCTTDWRAAITCTSRCWLTAAW